MAIYIRYHPSKQNVNDDTRLYLYRTFRDRVTKKSIKEYLVKYGRYGDITKIDPFFIPRLKRDVEEYNRKASEGLATDEELQSIIKRQAKVQGVQEYSYLEALLSTIWHKLKYVTFFNLDYSIFDYSNITLKKFYKSLNCLFITRDIIRSQVNHHLKVNFSRKIEYALHDTSTFYLESFYEGDLKWEDCKSDSDFYQGIPRKTKANKNKKRNLPKRGMSKDNKRNESQIVFSLLADQNKIPINYRVLVGNTAETHSLAENINMMKKDVPPEAKIILLADAGYDKPGNILYLREIGIDYVVLTYPYKKASSQIGILNYEDGTWLQQEDPKTKTMISYKAYDDIQIGCGKYKAYDLRLRLIAWFDSMRYDKEQRNIKKRAEDHKKKLDQGLKKGLEDNYTTYSKEAKKKLQKTEQPFVQNTALIKKQLNTAGYAGVITNLTDRDPFDVIQILETAKVRIQITKLDTIELLLYSDYHYTDDFKELCDVLEVPHIGGIVSVEKFKSLYKTHLKIDVCSKYNPQCSVKKRKENRKKSSNSLKTSQNWHSFIKKYFTTELNQK